MSLCYISCSALLQGIWFGVIHHVVDEHEWLIDCGSQVLQCVHGPFTEERELPWMSKGSPAHNALREVVADRLFLNNISYFLNARYYYFVFPFI